MALSSRRRELARGLHHTAVVFTRSWLQAAPNQHTHTHKEREARFPQRPSEHNKILNIPSPEIKAGLLSTLNHRGKQPHTIPKHLAPSATISIQLSSRFSTEFGIFCQSFCFTLSPFSENLAWKICWRSERVVNNIITINNNIISGYCHIYLQCIHVNVWAKRKAPKDTLRD